MRDKQTYLEAAHNRMDVELARNFPFARWLARPPFRNPPRGYRTSFQRRDSLGHEHLVNEHLIVQTEENLNYTMTETRKQHRNLTIASSK